MLTILLILMFVLLLFSGFFSGSETALFSLSELHLEQLDKTRRSDKTVLKLLDKPRQLIITILMGNETVNVAISTISAAIVIDIFKVDTPWINILIVLPILLFFGEILPKSIALKFNISFSRIIARPLQLFARIVTPLRWLVRHISDFIVNFFVYKPRRRGNILTQDVVKTIIEESEKEGLLHPDEKEFIYNIFDFGDLALDDIMTPRGNMFMLPEKMELTEMIRQIKESHFSKVPVYGENQDEITGVLFATDLLGLHSHDLENSAQTLNKILRRPFFVPVTKTADNLFKSFQHQKISVAIVLDEYGGVQGMVTMEDLLEIIFGEIADEYEVENQHYEKKGFNKYTVEGNMPLNEFNQVFEAEIEDEGVDTIGGFLFSLIGQLPEEKKLVSFQNFQFTIEKVQNNRIESILVRKYEH